MLTWKSVKELGQTQRIVSRFRRPTVTDELGNDLRSRSDLLT